MVKKHLRERKNLSIVIDCLIPAHSLVDLLVLDEVSLLSERLAAHFAAEGLLAGVRPKMHLDVRLVEETPVAYRTVVHRLLLATAVGVGGQSGRRGRIVGRRVHFILIGATLLLGRRVGDAETVKVVVRPELGVAALRVPRPEALRTDVRGGHVTGRTGQGRVR